MSHTSRTIALIDMDCFYCQVEEKLDPNLQGKPVAVVQYNLWREGGIIAANYLAKEKGVTKGLWMHEAKELCPDIQFARVPELRGRADLTKYREAGKQVAEVIGTFTKHLERASVDEAYIDLSESILDELNKGRANIRIEDLKSTHVVGCDTREFLANIAENHDTDGFCEADLKLAMGAVIVEKIRAEVYEKTGYRCSAGIAHNKMLAKLASSLHKPNKQTIMPQNAVNDFFLKLPLQKIKRLGGKFGKKVAAELNIVCVGELLKFSEEELIKKFQSKSGTWLYNIARGIDTELVLPKLIAKSISCAKQFPGKNALRNQKDIEYWINELSLEVSKRLQDDMAENNRKAKILSLSFVQEIDKNEVSNSKTCFLKSYDAGRICRDALEIVKKVCRKHDNTYHIKGLSLSATNFETIKNIRNIESFFMRKSESTSTNKNPETLSFELATCDLDGKYALHSIDSEKNQKSSSLPLSNSSDTSSPKSKNDSIQNNDKLKNNYRTLENLEEILNPIPKEKYTEDNSFFAVYFDSIEKEERNVSYDIQETELRNQSRSEYHSHDPSGNNDVKTNVSATASDNGNSFFDRFFRSLDQTSTEESSFHNNQKNGTIPLSEPALLSGGKVNHFEENCHKRYSIASTTIKEKTESNAKKDKNAKRRKIDKSGTCSIVNFLTTDPDNEPTETCLECRRKVKLTELESHSDYHVAKKLNRELNFQDAVPGSSKTKTSRAENGIIEFLKRKSR